MDRQFELEIVDQLLDAMENPTVELTDSVHEEPVENYSSTERFALEKQKLFGQTPLLAAVSGELPTPGFWKVFDETGVPVVLVRGEDGVVRGFLNVCGHRGSRLVEDKRGSARRLSCPFHAWSYNTDGTLAGIPAQKAFAGICTEDRNLKRVPVREHIGGIWVIPSPADSGDLTMDLGRHLGPFGAELARWNMADWVYVETRVHDVKANWKIAMDTFTETYHIPVVHKESLVPMGAGTATLNHQMGDHHRQVIPMQNILELRDLPREQWQAFAEWRFGFTYILYPNTVFLVAGNQRGEGHAELYQVFPGATVDRSVCLHSLYAFEPVDTEDDRRHYSELLGFFFDLVEHEDFRIAAGVDQGLRAGAHLTHLYGRNEPITQALHRAYERDLVGAGSG